MTPGAPLKVFTISVLSFHFGSLTMSAGSQWHSVFSPNLSPLHGTSIRRPARLAAEESLDAGGAGATATLGVDAAGGGVAAQPATTQANCRARTTRLTDGVELARDLDVLAIPVS